MWFVNSRCRRKEKCKLQFRSLCKTQIWGVIGGFSRKDEDEIEPKVAFAIRSIQICTDKLSWTTHAHRIKEIFKLIQAGVYKNILIQLIFLLWESAPNILKGGPLISTLRYDRGCGSDVWNRWMSRLVREMEKSACINTYADDSHLLQTARISAFLFLIYALKFIAKHFLLTMKCSLSTYIKSTHQNSWWNTM